MKGGAVCNHHILLSKEGKALLRCQCSRAHDIRHAVLMFVQHAQMQHVFSN